MFLQGRGPGARSDTREPWRASVREQGPEARGATQAANKQKAANKQNTGTSASKPAGLTTPQGRGAITPRHRYCTTVRGRTWQDRRRSRRRRAGAGRGRPWRWLVPPRRQGPASAAARLGGSGHDASAVVAGPRSVLGPAAARGRTQWHGQRPSRATRLGDRPRCQITQTRRAQGAITITTPPSRLGVLWGSAKPVQARHGRSQHCFGHGRPRLVCLCGLPPIQPAPRPRRAQKKHGVGSGKAAVTRPVRQLAAKLAVG